MDPVTRALMRVQGMPKFAAAAMAKEAKSDERKAITAALETIDQAEEPTPEANARLKSAVKAIVERHAEEQKASVATEPDDSPPPATPSTPPPSDPQE